MSELSACASCAMARTAASSICVVIVVAPTSTPISDAAVLSNDFQLEIDALAQIADLPGQDQGDRLHDFFEASLRLRHAEMRRAVQFARHAAVQDELAAQHFVFQRQGAHLTEVQALAEAADVDIANINAPGQIVLSGTAEGIQTAVERAKEFGIRRAIPLNVAGAYHSRLMKSAQDKLTAELSGVELASPSIPVVCNFAATSVSEPGEIRTMLANQVTGSVRWTQSIQTLIAMGHREFLELGPGKVLAGLVAKIDKDAIVHSAEDLAGLDALATVLG